MRNETLYSAVELHYFFDHRTVFNGIGSVAFAGAMCGSVEGQNFIVFINKGRYIRLKLVCSRTKAMKDKYFMRARMVPPVALYQYLFFFTTGIIHRKTHCFRIGQ